MIPETDVGDVSTDSGANGENDRQWREYEECLEEEDFEIPAGFASGIRVYTEDDFSTPATAGNSLRGSYRPEVVSGYNPYYVAEGDPFVVDINRWTYGYPGMPRRYELVILHEGEPMPFKIAVVSDDEDEFVPMEEINSWNQDDFDTTAVVERDNETVFSYTIVIPAWAFEKKGSYNIRTVARPIWEEAEQWGDEEDGVQYWERPWFAGGERHSIDYRLYYGSECEFPHRRDIPRRVIDEDVGLWWKTPEAATFAFRFAGLFLAPPRELYDWADVPVTLMEEITEVVENVELNQVFESPEPEVTLNLYAADHRYIFGGDAPLNEETLYLVMRDGEIIEEFLLEDVPIISGEGYYLGEWEAGAEVPIEIELTEEVATYQVLALPMPFDSYDQEAYEEALEDESNGESAYGRRDFRPRFSSAIQMKHVPD